MPETPNLSPARRDLAHAAVELYQLVLATPPGTPLHVDLAERFSATCAILFGLYPVETRRGVHVAAEGRTGIRLTDDTPPAAALVHMAQMVHELLELEPPDDLEHARRGFTDGTSALVRVAESLADPSLERETIRLALAEVVTAIGRIYPRAVADAAQAYALEQVEVARPSPGTKQRISGATVEIYAKAFVEQIEKHRDDAAPPSGLAS